MAQVDPRSGIIPKALMVDRETRIWVEELERFLGDLRERTGGGIDDVASATNNFFSDSFSPQIQQIRKELDGLPEFTVDTTGFTTDLTFITTDKVFA